MTWMIKQGDTTPPLESTLATGGSPDDISGYNEIRLQVMDALTMEKVIDETESGSSKVDVVTVDPAVVTFDWDASDTAQAGTYYAEWVITFGTGDVKTYPDDGFIKIVIEEGI